MSIRSATKALLSTIFRSSGKTTRTEDLGKRLEGKNRSLTYAEWLKRYGAEANEATLSPAGTERVKGSPDYGAAAETIIDRGLSKTGYADYLREKNEEAYRAATEANRAQNDAREAGNRSGYLAYLKKWESDQDDLMQKTLSHLAETRVTGSDAAYADALSAGLTEDRAKIVSRVAPAVGRYGMRRLREGIAGILTVSVSAGLSGAEAELLARACGVSAADAKKLRQTIESKPSGGAVNQADRWE